MCVCLCANVHYQGNSPSLNKPFVCFGCSLLWACCPPGCCLSALFESLIKALPLSPLAPLPSITFCVSFLVAICSLFLCLDVAFVFCVLYYAACLICAHGIVFILFYFKLRSLGFLTLPLQLLCLLTFLPLFYFSFLLCPYGFSVGTTIQLFLSPSETICCDRDIMWQRQL